MKKIFFSLIVTLSLSKGFSQNIGINASGATPHASAMLDVSSTNKGMLIPRMTTAQRTAIVSPATGLQVYDTDNNSCWFYNGSSWSQLSVGSNGWNLTGNTATNPATQFIGTTDNQPFRLRLNNKWAGELNESTKNYFIGDSAGAFITTGLENTGFGSHTLYKNTSGTWNTAMGSGALYANVGGYYNAAYGFSSLTANTSGFNNTAIGTYALANNTTGQSNTAIGKDALFTNTTGSLNAAAGEGALYSNTTGEHNTANGYQALYLNTTGSTNTANGYQALLNNITAGNNVANGYQALFSNTTGDGNNANGAEALFNNTTGNASTANGVSALASNTTGFNNTANGASALAFNTTGAYNTANGSQALLFNTIGNYNTANGVDALHSNTNGRNNTASGDNSLSSNTTGYNNTAIGSSALSSNTGGFGNIAIGYISGTHPTTPNISNTISIGNDGYLNAASNQVIIGNASSVGYYSHVPWSTFSDARIKTGIKEEVKGLDFIMRLRPVTYYKSIKEMVRLTGNKETADFPGKYDMEKIKFSGFLAQEVEQAAKETGYDFSGLHKPNNSTDLYALSYETFVVPLVKALQEQQVIIQQLEKRLALLETKK